MCAPSMAHITTDGCVIVESSFYTPDRQTRPSASGEIGGQRDLQVPLDGLETVRI